MKKSKLVRLVLITSALASCNKPQKTWENGNKVYMRSDTTAPYTQSHFHGVGIGGWYYAFRPYGIYRDDFWGGGYSRAGYYSDALTSRSNIGSNGVKGSIESGGFGAHGGYSVSS
jgi:hypothetical protein